MWEKVVADEKTHEYPVIDCAFQVEGEGEGGDVEFCFEVFAEDGDVEPYEWFLGFFCERFFVEFTGLFFWLAYQNQKRSSHREQYSRGDEIRLGGEDLTLTLSGVVTFLSTDATCVTTRVLKEYVLS